jgi:hypothetical protein
VSASVGVWKDALLRAAHIPARRAAVATAAPAITPADSQPIVSLVRQVFFPTAVIQRTRVLFAAADAETRISAVCEQAGRALAEMSGAMVAIVEASPSSAATLATKKPPRNSTGAEWWRGYSSQIAENLWRVPSALMNAPAQVGGISSQTLDLPFDYALFAASLADSETPGFCSLCDGAVLVLTAHRTRKEAAIRAKEQLLQCDVELVGTVLDGRTFPIPESIYRRL